MVVVLTGLLAPLEHIRLVILLPVPQIKYPLTQLLTVRIPRPLEHQSVDIPPISKVSDALAWLVCRRLVHLQTKAVIKAQVCRLPDLALDAGPRAFLGDQSRVFPSPELELEPVDVGVLQGMGNREIRLRRGARRGPLGCRRRRRRIRGFETQEMSQSRSSCCPRLWDCVGA
ncbi:hypothetical protein VTK56DRAFT_6953 [Thermocarpiscus australiensis]